MQKLFAFLLFPFLSLVASPEAFYITLPEDPAHSMSVHWIESIKSPQEAVLFYRKIGEANWKTTSFEGKTFKEAPFRINTCLLKDLESDTEYSFMFAGEEKSYTFRTTQATLNRPLKIVVGGDLYLSKTLFQKMNLVVANLKPDFILLGGDLAYVYTNGRNSPEKKAVAKWVSFFKELSKTYVQGEKVIPIATVVGNHDLSPKEKKERDLHSLFFSFFPFINQVSYRCLDVSDAISFFMLDTNHISKIKGEQTRWLKQSLEERKNKLWRLALYHVAAYPSIYDYSDRVPSLIRAHWVPLFEENKVLAVFENHNHAFKRTFPLLKDKIDPWGITYFGDGSWGVPPRNSRKKPWYLEKKEAVNTVFLLTVDKSALKVDTFDSQAKVIDTWISKTD